MGKKRRFFLPPRLINSSGQFNVVRVGLSQAYWEDLYYFLITLSWPGFLTVIVAAYLGTNALFALAYLAGGDCIANARPGSFWDAFFFSVQTMASIGYGAMYPKTDYANSLVVIEALGGLMGLAIASGLMLARFSKPTARVLFSRVAAIAAYNGTPTLMFRVANQRYNQILEAHIRLTLVRNEFTAEGYFMRRFHHLKLMRDTSSVFALTWTVMHPIDPTSPLYGATAQSLLEQEAEIVVTLTGLDETVSQTIHAHHSYREPEILWGVRFVDILSQTADGQRCIDYTRFHNVIPEER